MKKSFLILAFMAGTALSAADQTAQQTTAQQAAPAAQQTTAQQAAPAAQQTTAQQAAPAVQPAAAVPQVKEEPGIPYCLARGLCNIATGWLELPRCMIYDNCAIPVFGLIAGIPEGAILTVGRMFCGLFDIVSFGTSGNACHGKIFPSFVFQSKWMPPQK